MHFDYKALLAKLASVNKANVAAGVAFVSVNILIPVFHVNLGPEYIVLIDTLGFAAIHWVAVYMVANKPVPAKAVAQ